MKERTRKMLLIITLVLAGFTIVAKTILNSDYYNIVKAINKNYETQNPIDYQDEEINNIQNQETIENVENNQNKTNVQDETNINNQIDNNEAVDRNVIEDNSNEKQDSTQQNNNTDGTTMPSRPTIEM